jgi:hypothetical protein
VGHIGSPSAGLGLDRKVSARGGRRVEGIGSKQGPAQPSFGEVCGEPVLTVIGDKTGKVNEKGIAYYSDLVGNLFILSDSSGLRPASLRYLAIGAAETSDPRLQPRSTPCSKPASNPASPSSTGTTPKPSRTAMARSPLPRSSMISSTLRGCSLRGWVIGASTGSPSTR